MDYQKLDVWKEATQLANKIYQLTDNFPVKEQYRLIDQMCRASVSIASNIAEGIGRQYKKETIQFLFVARGSLYELSTQCYISLMRKYITDSQFSEVSEKINTCQKLLHGLIRYIRNSNLR